jgi:TolB-like protein
MLRSILSFLMILSAVGITACSTPEVVVSKPFPYIDDQDRSSVSITVFAFENYTDTPQAGKRAANLLEGLLSAKGYTTLKQVDIKERSLSEKRALARRLNSRFLLIGGLSEWRYKTGIDGEPAVSLSVKLVDVKNGSTVWSATGSDNSWGNASIGTTAQKLLAQMIN